MGANDLLDTIGRVRRMTCFIHPPDPPNQRLKHALPASYKLAAMRATACR